MTAAQSNACAKALLIGRCHRSFNSRISRFEMHSPTGFVDMNSCIRSNFFMFLPPNTCGNKLTPNDPYGDGAPRKSRVDACVIKYESSNVGESERARERGVERHIRDIDGCMGRAGMFFSVYYSAYLFVNYKKNLLVVSIHKFLFCST